MSYHETADHAADGSWQSHVYQYDSTQMLQEFVYRYYAVLAEAPHDAWRSYTANAQYVHVDGDGPIGWNTLKPAAGQHQIHSNIVYQRFYECEFHIRSVNVLNTWDAFLVMVTGYMSRNRGQPAVFIQTFVVECIHEINQYAISNSILKVLVTDAAA